MNRWWLLLPALGTASWLVFTDSYSSSSVAISPPTERAAAMKDAASRPLAKPQAKAVAAPIRPLMAREALYMSSTKDRSQPALFGARVWVEPVAAANKEPMVQEVPLFPYTVVGRKKESGAWVVFLMRDDQVFVVHEGQVLESDYQVSRVSELSMTVVYTRLNHAYEIRLGEEME